jgi:CheY-like chemotaxis protein
MAASLPSARALFEIDHYPSLLDEIFIAETLFMPRVEWKMLDRKQDCSTRLLIVDDETSIRMSLSYVLAEVGYSVRSAEDGFSALAEIRNGIPDIILSSLSMPGMSGFEFLSVVRRRFPSIWVIAMSGAFSGDEVPSGIAADDFYPKGGGIRALVQIIGGRAPQQRLPASRLDAYLHSTKRSRRLRSPLPFDHLPEVPADLLPDYRRVLGHPARNSLRPLPEFGLLRNCRTDRVGACPGTAKVSPRGESGRPARVELLRKRKLVPMRTIAERNVLLRVRAELPDGLKLATNEFREGWNFVAGDASRLEKKIRTRGWNFIRIADGSLRSGVGETSQEAIANALRLALRRISENSNAAKVERIELTQYPWFFLARIQIYPYRIQQTAILPATGEDVCLPPVPLARRLSVHAPALFPHFGSAMPQLKRMLVMSGGPAARPQ